MSHSITTQLWIETDKAQLEKYISYNQAQLIKINHIPYRIKEGYLDDYNVPMVKLVRESDSVLQTVRLSLIWDQYKNYSALGQKQRLELLWDLKVKV